jgi:hypothetical protein
MPHYTITVQPSKKLDDEGEAVHKSLTRIIKAKNEARAIAFVVSDTLSVKLAEPADFMALAKAGGEIETAKEDAP